MSEREGQFAQLLRALERIERDLYSTDPENPGLALRLDRIERQAAMVGKLLSWIGGGGLIGLATTVYLLWKLLQVWDGKH